MIVLNNGIAYPHKFKTLKLIRIKVIYESFYYIILTQYYYGCFYFNFNTLLYVLKCNTIYHCFIVNNHHHQNCQGEQSL